jgi:hypothetical protein
MKILSHAILSDSREEEECLCVLVYPSMEIFSRLQYHGEETFLLQSFITACSVSSQSMWIE